jgi:wyosine [tRNA(Phe)-imidazoG37] synthetase (radical SAM superfamily)
MLKPDKAYLAIPTRPPAEASVSCPSEHSLNRAYQIFSERLSSLEYLIGYEGNAFASTGDARQDLLSITAVHPMREEAVRELLRKADSSWEIVSKLMENGDLTELEYQGKKFYMRRLSSPGINLAES